MNSETSDSITSMDGPGGSTGLNGVADGTSAPRRPESP